MGSTVGVTVAAVLLTIPPQAFVQWRIPVVPPAYQGLLEKQLILYSLLIILMLKIHRGSLVTESGRNGWPFGAN
jgi:hypothetical protein